MMLFFSEKYRQKIPENSHTKKKKPQKETGKKQIFRKHPQKLQRNPNGKTPAKTDRKKVKKCKRKTDRINRQL